MQRALTALLVLGGLAAAGCGNPLFSPCEGQVDCVEGLRCIDMGNEQRLCTKPCSTTKATAGYPDGFDNDDLFVDGSGAASTVSDPECADAPVDILVKRTVGKPVKYELEAVASPSVLWS